MITLSEFYERVETEAQKYKHKYLIFKNLTKHLSLYSYNQISKARRDNKLPNLDVLQHLTFILTSEEYRYLIENYPITKQSNKRQALAYEENGTSLFYNRLEEYFKTDNVKPTDIKKYLTADGIDELEAKQIATTFKGRYLRYFPPTLDVLIVLSDLFTKEEVAIIAYEYIRLDLLPEDERSKATKKKRQSPEEEIYSTQETLVNLLKHLPQEFKEKQRIRRFNKRLDGIIE